MKNIIIFIIINVIEIQDILICIINIIIFIIILLVLQPDPRTQENWVMHQDPILLGPAAGPNGNGSCITTQEKWVLAF